MDRSGQQHQRERRAERAADVGARERVEHSFEPSGLGLREHGVRERDGRGHGPLESVEVHVRLEEARRSDRRGCRKARRCRRRTPRAGRGVRRPRVTPRSTTSRRRRAACWRRSGSWRPRRPSAAAPRSRGRRAERSASRAWRTSPATQRPGRLGWPRRRSRARPSSPRAAALAKAYSVATRAGGLR